jgi:hypothetical protein
VLGGACKWVIPQPGYLPDIWEEHVGGNWRGLVDTWCVAEVKEARTVGLGWCQIDIV